jgi:hypothetical protein
MDLTLDPVKSVPLVPVTVPKTLYTSPWFKVIGMVVATPGARPFKLSADGVITQKESNNGGNLEKKLLHKKYIENMG